MRSMLDGIRILDLTSYVAGPGCTMFLCDMGAEVIKIEKPGGGDRVRTMPPFIGDASVSFATLNRGKKSIIIDLKRKEGISLFKELVLKADVLVEDFRPGTLEKLGIGYHQLKKINPRLVMCAVTGYGQYGPLASQPPYDAIVQSLSGLMRIANDPVHPPVVADPLMVDVSTAMYAAFSICAALFARERTGEGEFLDVAKLDVALQLLEGRLLDGHPHGPEGDAKPLPGPPVMPFGPFPSQDGRVIILCDEDDHFERLCLAMQEPDLARDPRFYNAAGRKENARQLEERISAWTRRHRSDTLIQALNAKGVPGAPVNGMKAVFTHPHILARDMIAVVDQPGAGPIKIFGPALKAANSRVCVRGPAPAAGADNREILEKILKKSGPEIVAVVKTGAMG